MRVLYIIGIVIAFFFTIIMAAGTVGTSDERNSYRYNYDTYDYDYSTPAYVESTYVAVGISMVYFLFVITLYILSLVIVKTSVARVFAIVGLSLTLIMLIWGLLVLENPRNLSFDEVGGAWILYGLITLAIAIVGTVQAFRYHNQKRTQAQHPATWNQYPPYGNPYQQYPPQQPYNQGYPPYPPQQGQPPYPPAGYPPYPPQQGQPPYPPPPPGQAPWPR
ncbi:MAG: hypothetical protein ACRC3B_08415 [Bacteroidia bacterium]